MTTLDKLGGRRPTWAEIDLGVLRNNFLTLRRFLPSTVRIIPVLKADAYGHGAVAVAKCLETLKVDVLAVAIAEEAVALRDAGVQEKVLLLNGFWPGQEQDVVHYELTPAVYHADSIRRLALAAMAQQRQTSCHLKIDTGMARLGIDLEEANALLETAKANHWINCEGIYTHLSSAENIDNPSSHAQIRLFGEFLKSAENQGHSFSWRHVANSAGILNFRESWFDSVRSGLLLYGVNPMPLPLTELTIKPILSLKSRILQLRNVRSGSAIGYGGDFTVTRNSVIATLPIGYADGLMRQISGRGEVLIHGSRAPIVGRISMDLTLIDVTDVENAAVGDEVVLIGCQGGEQIGVEEVAVWAGTIPYEILCRVGPRVPRMFLENGKGASIINS